MKKVRLSPGVESIGIGAFQGCEALAEINLDEGLLSIKDMAFEGCVSLTSLRLPSSLRILGDYAFAHCTGITAERIVLPDQMHTLGKQVFMDGPTIKEIVFLAEPKFPNTDALQDCAGLTDVYYHGTEALWKVNGYLVGEGVTVHFGYTGN